MFPIETQDTTTVNALRAPEPAELIELIDRLLGKIKVPGLPAIHTPDENILALNYSEAIANMRRELQFRNRQANLEAQLNTDTSQAIRRRKFLFDAKVAGLTALLAKQELTTEQVMAFESSVNADQFMRPLTTTTPELSLSPFKPSISTTPTPGVSRSRSPRLSNVSFSTTVSTYVATFEPIRSESALSTQQESVVPIRPTPVRVINEHATLNDDEEPELCELVEVDKAEMIERSASASRIETPNWIYINHKADTVVVLEYMRGKIAKDGLTYLAREEFHSDLAVLIGMLKDNPETRDILASAEVVVNKLAIFHPEHAEAIIANQNRVVEQIDAQERMRRAREAAELAKVQEPLCWTPFSFLSSSFKITRLPESETARESQRSDPPARSSCVIF